MYAEKTDYDDIEMSSRLRNVLRRKELDVLKKEHQGSLLILTARGTREEILQKVQTQNPIFCEVIPLTLEEIFISETEVAGYEVKNIFW